MLLQSLMNSLSGLRWEEGQLRSSVVLNWLLGALSVPHCWEGKARTHITGNERAESSIEVDKKCIKGKIREAGHEISSLSALGFYMDMRIYGYQSVVHRDPRFWEDEKVEFGDSSDSASAVPPEVLQQTFPHNALAGWREAVVRFSPRWQRPRGGTGCCFWWAVHIQKLNIWSCHVAPPFGQTHTSPSQMHPCNCELNSMNHS